ncbi:hypothetical protein GCM10011380_13090 [Sphingomonas metalli]|uniref:Peptidase S1 domain-containing protein n=1 Tax=Sphingomonas metalli TaxID=1779358 RepID=A0A916T046_9SPHN|nr:hypothetical protein GCM10011380_13090 [Sphingomonas metalli]
MDRGAAGSFVCSGSLLGDRRSILTAGHCVSDGAGTAAPIKTTAYFYNGSDPDTIPWQSSAATAVDVSDYFVNAAYTGEVIDQNDIAVLRLSELAPLFANSYDLYDGDDLSLTDFNTAGYGRRSTVGGDLGVDAGVGRRRQGDNRYEFRLGDPILNGAFDDEFGKADYSHVYLADFDNGKRANDAACVLTGFVGVQSYKFCDLGRGPTEATTAPGDSGGPQFVDGKLASVTSFGLTYYNLGDIDKVYNDSFGEYSGFVPTSIHRNWINSVLAVPEPSTWALMIAGFGLIGGSMRRRTRTRIRFSMS